jgi:hypothetical protein
MGARSRQRLRLTVDNHPLRAFLAAGGYAWAASSSRNEYDVGWA